MALDYPTKPPATRERPTREVLHGQVSIDPYRWLEDGGAADVATWTVEQNAYARAMLARPGREAVSRRLAQVLELGVVGAPVERGGRYFHRRRAGSENQPILYVREGLAGPDRILFDPNARSSTGIVALDWWYPSSDGRFVAFGLSERDDENSTLHVIDVKTSELLSDTISHTRFCTLEWQQDGEGFYYTRYPAPGTVPAGEEHYHLHVFYHRLGADPENDLKIFGEGRDMTELPVVHLSPNGRWLVVFARLGWDRVEVYVRDLEDPAGTLRPLTTGVDALFEGKVAGDTLYVYTTWQAPRGRLIAIDLRAPNRDEWREIVAERPDVTLQPYPFCLAQDQLVLHETKDAVSRVAVYALDGMPRPSPSLPSLGSVAAIEGHSNSDEVFIAYESFTTPTTVFRCHVPTAELTVWAAIDPPANLDSVEARQVFYRSKDGTRIPMFIIERKGVQHDGETPTLLTGYGGFNAGMMPFFAPRILPWIEEGGIFAVSCLRGGNEYGEEWHRAGMLDKKQNVFDDFIAAAEFLFHEGYTRPERLAISGTSNGGLLVGAALTQRPELFQAVVCRGPLLDMLRYHNFQIAKLWVSEYGSADDAEQMDYLWAYSPYHNVARDARYPAVLFMTGECDSRVDPMHARKMAALLQNSGTQAPVLLLVQPETGHGAGKPLVKELGEQTDIWTFLGWQLGVNWEASEGGGS